MIWIIVSIPFWISGGLCFLGAIFWASDGMRAKEPIREAGPNTLKALLMAGIFLYIAAKISS